MADWLKEYMGQLKDVWLKLNKKTKIIIGTITIGVFLAFIMLILYGSGSQYQTLFNHLDPKDADSIMKELDEQGIDYQLLDSGKTIAVPANIVHKTRLNMAGAGLPTQGVVGFEIFDQSRFGTTDFERNVNYYRALGGELSRSIQAMDAVEYAKVQITAPKDSIFIAEERGAEASVLLKLIPDYQISQQQIKAMVNLVASAVQGLGAESVTIVDTAGNLLSSYLEEEDDEETSIFDQELTLNQFELQNRLSTEIRNDLRALLTRVLGPDNFTVQVKAKLDFDRRQRESRTFQPVVDDQGIIRSQEEHRENYTGTITGSGGVPGTTSNVPQYQTVDGEEEAGSYSSSDIITNYEINEIVERHVYSPGNIKNISTAVIINNAMPEEDLEKIRSAVQAAVGFDSERGDTLAVTSLNFDNSIEEEISNAQMAEAAAQRNKMLIYAGLISLIFIAILVFLFISRLQSKRDKEMDKNAIDYIIDEDLDEQIAVTAETELSEEQKKRKKIREELTELVNEKPEEVTEIIKSWLIDE